MDFQFFGEQHPPDHLGSNLKDDLCHHPIISRIKHAEFWVKALDGLRKDLETVPLPRGALVGLAPQTKLQAPQSEIRNTINQCFCQISECQAPRTNVKTPIEDFLATVLPRNPNARSSCTKSIHLLGRKRVEFSSN